MEPNQLNVEYWFRLLYECMHGSCYGSVDMSQFIAWMGHVWLWIIIIGYVVSFISLILIAYATMRLFELREKEEHFYSTLIPMPGAKKADAHPRWEHIQSLSESMNPNDWRTAIIEADIMLDEALLEKGYKGAGVGEKLKSADHKKFVALNDAWEAHKVRNQIAHEGSSFNIPDSLAKRTMSHYEAVFREFRII